MAFGANYSTATFPSNPLNVSELTWTECNKRKKNEFDDDDESSKPKPKKAMLTEPTPLIKAETERMEYYGAPIATDNCKYVVGIVDKKSGIVSVVDASSLVVNGAVKAFKHTKDESKRIGDKNALARNQLGEAFGTKKRKTVIKALEKNQVDASGIDEKAANDIIENIAKNSSALADKEDRNTQLAADKSIPPCDSKVKTCLAFVIIIIIIMFN